MNEKTENLRVTYNKILKVQELNKIYCFQTSAFFTSNWRLKKRKKIDLKASKVINCVVTLKRKH